jgi:hypothetical protein
MSEASFTAEPVSLGQFRKVHRALSDAGLIATSTGFQGFGGKGVETRMRLTEAGWELLGSFGIRRDDVSLHYVASGEAESEDPSLRCKGRPNYHS